MKNKDLFILETALNSLSNIKGIKFAYAISRNKKIISVILEPFTEIIKPSNGYNLFDKERGDLCIKHSEKDDQGKPLTVGDRYSIADDSAFKSELDILREKHSESVDEHEKKVEEYNELMEEEAEDIKFYPLNIEHVPNEITANQLDLLLDNIIIDESQGEK